MNTSKWVQAIIWLNWASYFCILVYCFLDGYQTLLLMEHGAKEINPIIRYFMTFLTPEASIYGVKVVAMGLACVLLLYFHKKMVNFFKEAA